MLASFATPANRGRVFGFHRGMDHAGAVVGPLLASAFLFFYPGEYRTLFALTIIPGAIAVALLFAVKEEEAPTSERASAPAVPGLPAPYLPRSLLRFLSVLALFTLGNSTDAFLLLKLSDAAGGAQLMPLLWAALHVVKSTTSIAFGGLSDRIGRRAVIGSGWLIYAIVYAGFAVSVSLPALVGWFLAYGLYFGLAEGAEKALVADLAPASHRGVAFGWLTAVQGIGALAASLLFGFIWTAAGAAAAFATGAALALAASALLFLAVPHRTQ
jgi:MFS family permease